MAACSIHRHVCLVATVATCFLASKAMQVPDEQRLYKTIMGNYVKTVKPIVTSSDPLQVLFSIRLKQIVDLTWIDPALAWNVSEFEDVVSLRIPAEQVWKPDTFIFNNADNGSTGFIHGKFVQIRHSGLVTWPVPVRLRSSCVVKIAYFPFDYQYCWVQFGSWIYSHNFVDYAIRPNAASVDLATYINNSEWALLAMQINKSVNFRSRSTEPHPYLTMSLYLRRNTFFYLFNIIVPCIMLSVLTLMTFWLPPTSGEKITLGLSVFLAFSMFMLLIADEVPASSDAVPIIGIYLCVVMTMTSLSVIFAVFVTNLYHKGVKLRPAPRWVACICIRFLSVLVGVSRDVQLLASTIQLPDHCRFYLLHNKVNLSNFDNFSSYDQYSQLYRKSSKRRRGNRQVAPFHENQHYVFDQEYPATPFKRGNYVYSPGQVQPEMSKQASAQSEHLGTQAMGNSDQLTSAHNANAVGCEMSSLHIDALECNQYEYYDESKSNPSCSTELKGGTPGNVKFSMELPSSRTTSYHGEMGNVNNHETYGCNIGNTSNIPFTSIKVSVSSHKDERSVPCDQHECETHLANKEVNSFIMKSVFAKVPKDRGKRKSNKSKTQEYNSTDLIKANQDSRSLNNQDSRSLNNSLEPTKDSSFLFFNQRDNVLEMKLLSPVQETGHENASPSFTLTCDDQGMKDVPVSPEMNFFKTCEPNSSCDNNLGKKGIIESCQCVSQTIKTTKSSEIKILPFASVNPALGRTSSVRSPSTQKQSNPINKCSSLPSTPQISPIAGSLKASTVSPSAKSCPRSRGLHGSIKRTVFTSTNNFEKMHEQKKANQVLSEQLKYSQPAKLQSLSNPLNVQMQETFCECKGNSDDVWLPRGANESDTDVEDVWLLRDDFVPDNSHYTTANSLKCETLLEKSVYHRHSLPYLPQNISKRTSCSQRNSLATLNHLEQYMDTRSRLILSKARIIVAEWQTIATVVDRLLFCITFFATVFAYIFLLLIAPYEHNALQKNLNLTLSTSTGRFDWNS